MKYLKVAPGTQFGLGVPRVSNGSHGTFPSGFFIHQEKSSFFIASSRICPKYILNRLSTSFSYQTWYCSLDLLKSRCHEVMRCTGKGGSKIGRRAFRLYCSSDTCGRREGRRKAWVGRLSDCSTVLRNVPPG